MKLAIECMGLTKEYRGRSPVNALRGLDLQVPEGEVFGLIGHNGAGKTTTLRILAGILGKSGGTAKVLGLEPGSMEARRIAAYLPDEPGFPASWMSPPEMIRFVATLDSQRRRWDDRRVAALLDRVGLEERTRPVSSFSRGMRRKLALALALMGDPRVLMLDEPTGDLDPDARMKFREILRDLKRQGASVLLSSHILSELETACDRVAFLREGSLLAIHDVDRDQPGAPVRIVYGPTADFRETGQAPLEKVVPADAKDEQLKALLATGATVMRVEPAIESLESLFRKYMSTPPETVSGEGP